MVTHLPSSGQTREVLLIPILYLIMVFFVACILLSVFFLIR